MKTLGEGEGRGALGCSQSLANTHMEPPKLGHVPRHVPKQHDCPPLPRGGQGRHHKWGKRCVGSGAICNGSKPPHRVCNHQQKSPCTKPKRVQHATPNSPPSAWLIHGWAPNMGFFEPIKTNPIARINPWARPAQGQIFVKK